MDNLEHIPNLCSVTHELVLETANENPDLFIKDGVINIYAVLFHVGFYLDHNDYLKGIRTTENVIVRCHKDPYLVYRTKIYSGKCRKAVQRVEDNGKIIYHKNKWHKMKTKYEKQEVVQPEDIYKYIPKDQMDSILDIGDVLNYNKGLQS